MHMYKYIYTIAVPDDSSTKKDLKNDIDPGETNQYQCPLCREDFQSQEALVYHADFFHSVKPENLVRFQAAMMNENALSDDQHLGGIEHSNKHPSWPYIPSKGTKTDKYISWE